MDGVCRALSSFWGPRCFPNIPGELTLWYLESEAQSLALHFCPPVLPQLPVGRDQQAFESQSQQGDPSLADESHRSPVPGVWSFQRRVDSARLVAAVSPILQKIKLSPGDTAWDL